MLDDINYIEKIFAVYSEISRHPENTDLAFHVHDDDEIYIFLDGNATYKVEGFTYENLKPIDVILIKHSEYHCIKHHEPLKQYKRFIINLSPDFFRGSNCAAFFENLFARKKPGEGSLISAEDAKICGIPECLSRYDKYMRESPQFIGLLARGLIYEIVYLLNKPERRENGIKNSTVQGTINYINQNLTSQLTASMLGEKFYISSRHLNRIFKEETGLTIKQYITLRRFHKTQNLYRSGMNLTSACIQAGFSSYNNFYTAFSKAYGKVPSDMLTDEL